MLAPVTVVCFTFPKASKPMSIVTWSGPPGSSTRCVGRHLASSHVMFLVRVRKPPLASVRVRLLDLLAHSQTPRRHIVDDVRRRRIVVRGPNGARRRSV